MREKEGDKLSFELLYPNEGAYPAIAEQIQHDWANLGVKVNLKGVTYQELVQDHLETRDYQAALVDLNLSRSPDPDPYPFWHQAQITGGQNYSRWDDRQASEYLEQGRILVDTAERMKRYRNFQVRFAQELPALPLYFPVYSYGVDEQVQHVSMGPLFDPSERFNTITSWFLQTKRQPSGGSVTTAVPATAAPAATEAPAATVAPTAQP